MDEKDKKLLIRYFQGKCTSDENIRARELLQNPEAEAFFRHLSWSEWNEPVQGDESARLLHTRWKKKVNARIRATEKTTAKRSTLSLRTRKTFGYAAIWLGIFFVSGLLIWQWQANGESDQTAMIEKANRQGVPVRYVLPDNSTVFLAAGSTISYPENFKGKSREVQLQGEAFFEVSKNPHKAFIIHTGEISTRVLGTSFRVTAIEGRPLEVAVATGKVGVSHKDKTLATLTPGYKLSWYPEEQKAVTGQTDIEGLEQWKNGDLIFDNLNMEYIAEELQKRYGVSIIFADEEVKKSRVSGTFAASKSAGQVMKVLAVAGKFAYESEDDKTFRIYKTD